MPRRSHSWFYFHFALAGIGALIWHSHNKAKVNSRFLTEKAEVQAGPVYGFADIGMAKRYQELADGHHVDKAASLFSLSVKIGMARQFNKGDTISVDRQESEVEYPLVCLRPWGIESCYWAPAHPALKDSDEWANSPKAAEKPGINLSGIDDIPINTCNNELVRDQWNQFATQADQFYNAEIYYLELLSHNGTSSALNDNINRNNQISLDANRSHARTYLREQQEVARKMKDNCLDNELWIRWNSSIESDIKLYDK